MNSQLSIAIATRHFGLPLRQAIERAGSIGARAIQIDVRNELRPDELSQTGRRQFKHSLSERLLSLSGFEFPTRRALYDLEHLDARIAGLKKALEFAFQMGAQVVVGRTGRIPTDTECQEFDLLAQVLNDLARHSNHVGASFAITPNVDSAETLRALFDRIDAGPLGINLDPGGMVMNGIDWTHVFREFHERVIAVQVRDGIRDIDGQGVEVAVGRGEVAWDECLALLHEGHFKGWLTVTRSAGDDKPGDMARAIRFLRHVGQES